MASDAILLFGAIPWNYLNFWNPGRSMEWSCFLDLSVKMPSGNCGSSAQPISSSALG
jgi:hypothetical protein